MPDTDRHALPGVESLARALYETEPGTNGYPPPHLSTPWKDAIHMQRSMRERARKILAICDERQRRAGPLSEEATGA